MFCRSINCAVEQKLVFIQPNNTIVWTGLEFIGYNVLYYIILYLFNAHYYAPMANSMMLLWESQIFSYLDVIRTESFCYFSWYSSKFLKNIWFLLSLAEKSFIQKSNIWFENFCIDPVDMFEVVWKLWYESNPTLISLDRNIHYLFKLWLDFTN